MKLLFKNINWFKISLLVSLLAVYFIPCFFAAMAEEEGTLGTSFLPQLFLASFHALQYPLHVFFWNVFPHPTIGLYIIELAINFFFYSFLLERSIYIFKYYTNHNRINA